MMKKYISWVLLLVLALSLAGCGRGEKAEYVQDAETPDWGITLTAENVTPTGLTIRCTQSGGAPSGELQTGDWYELQQQSGSGWLRLDYKDLETDEVGWDSVAYLIPMDSSPSWEVDWQWLYGQLSPGQYRIAKEVMDFRGSGDYDKAIFCAEFTVE